MEQLLIVGQIIESKYEYRQDFWQIFLDFRKSMITYIERVPVLLDFYTTTN